MTVTRKIEIDLAENRIEPAAYAVQGDSGRVLEIALTSGGTAWEIPADATVLIRYRKQDGSAGMYDTLPDGTCAWRAEGNVLHVVLAPQVCASAGAVLLMLTVIQDSRQISTFRIVLQVEDLFGEDAPGEYLNLTAWMESWLTAHGKGEQGDAGVSPTVSVAEIPGGHRVTLTDSTHTEQFDVLDGSGSEIAALDAAVKAAQSSVTELEGSVSALETRTGVDQITAQGKSGIWHYRKWESGAAECWGIFETTGGTTVSLPFTMADANYTVNFSITQNGNIVERAWIGLYDGGNGKTTQYFPFIAQRQAGSESVPLHVDITVRGRWK